MRCFGFEQDGSTVREDEAVVLREMARRVQDGDSLRSVLTWLNDEGVRTSSGKVWQGVTARRLLTNPRLRGGVLDEPTADAMVELFSDPSRQKNPNASVRTRRYLLTGGLLICGLCGAPLASQPSNSGKRGYVCRAKPPSNGCARIRIAADPVEDEVAVRVLTRLASPTVRKRLTAASLVDGTGALHTAQVAELEQRLQQLGQDYADGLIGRTEFLAARSRVAEKQEVARQALAAAAKLGEMPSHEPEDLARWWEDASIDKRRDLVAVVLDHVVVGPATTRGPSGLDEDRLTWLWR